MDIHPAGTPVAEIDRLMTVLIDLRPIARVSTIGPDGTAKPPSLRYFMGVGSDPPILALSAAALVRREAA